VGLLSLKIAGLFMHWHQFAEAFSSIDGLLAEAGTSNGRVLLVEFTVTAAR